MGKHCLFLVIDDTSLQPPMLCCCMLQDLAASSLIVTEAGGALTDVDGSPFSIWSGRLLAASSPELNAIIATAKTESDANVYKSHGQKQPPLHPVSSTASGSAASSASK